MGKPDDGGPAFPQLDVHFGISGESVENSASGGMTLRDYFAAAAMQGQVSSSDAMQEVMDECREAIPEATHADRLEQSQFVVAWWAYKMADAMLKAREARP